MNEQKEKITYLTACISAQSLILSLLELKDHKSILYKKNVKIQADKLLNVMIQELKTDIRKLYDLDEIQVMESVRGIERIGKLISEGDTISLTIIDQMLQKDFDFNKYKLVEI